MLEGAPEVGVSMSRVPVVSVPVGHRVMVVVVDPSYGSYSVIQGPEKELLAGVA